MYQCGILNCIVTKQLTHCISVHLGDLQTVYDGVLDIWGNFSEVGLLSLRYDLLNNRCSPERGFTIEEAECCITGQMTTCIHARVQEITETDTDGQPTGRIAEIYANFSLNGIDQMTANLRKAGNPLSSNVIDEGNANHPYAWEVYYWDSSDCARFDDQGKEIHFGDVIRENIELLRIVPRDILTELPIYRIRAREGFFVTHQDGQSEKLPVPFPDEPFKFEYHRYNVVTFGCQFGTSTPWPMRITECLGWSVQRPEGELVFMIGVEQDGSWSIHRRGIIPPSSELQQMTEDEFNAALAADRQSN